MTTGTQNNQAEQLTHKKYQVYYQNSPIGIAILDEQGNFVETNPAFIDHLESHNSQVVNCHYTEVVEGQMGEKLRSLFEILIKNKLPYAKDVLSIKTSGDNHRIFEVTLSKFYDTDDQSFKTMLFTEDITQQKDTHMALLQSEKLALTGRLAASLAHEINNPLQTSLGCLGLVDEMLQENDDKGLTVYIKLAIEELQRSARIVKKLRDLNQSSDISERVPVNLGDIIEDVLVLTKNRLEDKGIMPLLAIEKPLMSIPASKDQMQQVLLNLIMNAIDELSDGGQIFLELTKTNRPKGVAIKIRDTGNGIDPEITHNIFDPFFTTKDGGLGLGLYISKQIIENHSGTMEFSSQPGKGTEFQIWLPAGEPFSEEEES